MRSPPVLYETFHISYRCGAYLPQIENNTRIPTNLIVYKQLSDTVSHLSTDTDLLQGRAPVAAMQWRWIWRFMLPNISHRPARWPLQTRPGAIVHHLNCTHLARLFGSRQIISTASPLLVTVRLVWHCCQPKMLSFK